MNEFIVFAAKYLIGAIAVGAVAFLLMDSSKQRCWKYVYVAMLALPLGYGLARLAGVFFGHHQPFAELGFEPLVPHEVDNSFPSDHTVIGGVFSSVVFLADRRFGLVLWVLTLLMGLGRVAAGLHWAVDIIAAVFVAVLSVVIAKLVLSYFKRLQRSIS